MHCLPVNRENWLIPTVNKVRIVIMTHQYPEYFRRFNPPPKKNEDRVMAIYRFIIFHKMKYDGNSPTIREIMAACRISSTSMVRFYLGRLEDKGKIKLENHRILVTGGRWRLNNGAITGS